MYIPRDLQQVIIRNIRPGRVVFLYGPRRSGKTTLVQNILKSMNKKSLFVSGENRDTRSWMESESFATFRAYIGSEKLLVLDEAQHVQNVGLNLKIMVDHFPELSILATGSSSFELAHYAGEPLVGRKREFLLYPIAQRELEKIVSLQDTEATLEQRLLYGMYPEVLTATTLYEKRAILNDLVDHYLYKDILAYEGIRRSGKILDLLRMLALQIGKEVSLHEVGAALSLDSRTVEKYIDLLQYAFVLKKLPGFSRNLRKEITKMSRYYFLDNGVRNALLNNFNPISMRDDIGALWENYLYAERMKKIHYDSLHANVYFWRTYDQQEVDYVEERDGELYGYEWKWGALRQKAPAQWSSAYPDASYECITRENYRSFIL